MEFPLQDEGMAPFGRREKRYGLEIPWPIHYHEGGPLGFDPRPERVHEEIEGMSPSWPSLYKEKVTQLPKALKAVRRGAKVFLSTGCAEPQYLVQGLLDMADELHDVQLLHFITLGNAPYTDRRFDSRFRHNVFFVGPGTRDAINEGRADYTPVFTSEIPHLFRKGIVPIDVALIQVSPPDSHGFVSLGISVDIVKAAVESARTVIAQVNRAMPRTMGDTFIHISQITHIVEHDHPLMEFRFAALTRTEEQVARNVARLIRDGDTIHVGMGHIPHGVLSFLKDKVDLGIHTEAVSDPFIDLIESGAVTGEKKGLHARRIVCSFCIGTRRIYDYVHENPLFLFLPAEEVYNPLVVARNRNMVSIVSAQEVDLSGQVCSESRGFHFYSGLGGRLDFIRGAAMSEGGRSIVALPSTTEDGSASRIVPYLQEGAGVVATRGDVKYVVTEFGIAYLHGKSIRERAMALINIAHPKFRKELLEEAKKRAYVYPDQILVETETFDYPEEETRAQLKDGRWVTIRPIKPTDEPLLQDFFYSHSNETIYRRYFRAVKAMPHTTAQTLVNLDYRERMAFVATVGEIGLEKIVGVARYAAEKDMPGFVEVAYTIHDDFQGLGLGSILQDKLEDYARRMGFQGVCGYLFQDNLPMLKVFAKKGKYHKERVEGGVLRVWRYFSEPSETGDHRGGEAPEEVRP
jgi:acyl-CoA hydrolase/GNAT superfamily N-acetyltransferase